jgi:hypothetical protein
MRSEDHTLCVLLILALTSAATPRLDAADVAAAAQSEPVDLSGPWQFRVDADDRGMAEKWYASEIAFPRTLQVPGAWNAQGVTFETPAQLERYLNSKPREQLAGPVADTEKLFHVYPGPGWYRRTVRIPEQWRGKRVWLQFGGVHRNADVWINGRPLGTHTGYVVPFKYDVTQCVEPGREARITVRVDARRNRQIDPLMGAMDTLDFLYVEWGGIHGKVVLEATGDPWIEDVFVVPRPAEEAAEVTVATGGSAAAERHAPRAKVRILDARGQAVAEAEKTVRGNGEPVAVPLKLAGAKLWSPSQPYLYTAEVTLADGTTRLAARSVRFGMRDFRVHEGRFLLNGRPIFLRGYGDDCIYPDSIAPPGDPREFRRRFRIVKDFGFNYARHHSWIPTQEYLDVADEMGVLLQPEFPQAYRWDLPHGDRARRLAVELWRQVIRHNRNHPSIVAWCMGNELYDGFEQAGEMHALARELDPTRPVIDSDGVARRPRPTLDFWVWQFDESGSLGFKDGKYALASQQKPVVAHEMGYFVTLPDLRQIDLFARGLKPYWLEEARARARKQAVLERYAGWVDRSNRLQATCLKTNIEAARRSGLQGYDVWLFQDYPWCAEGVVDMFYRPKAITAEEFRRFNSPTVVLIAQDQRNYRPGQKAAIPLLVSRFEQAATRDATLEWEVRAAGVACASGAERGLEIPCGQVKQLAVAEFTMPSCRDARRLRFAARLTDAQGTAHNDWSLWVFPRDRVETAKMAVAGDGWLAKRYPGAARFPAPQSQQAALLVTGRWGRDVLGFLKRGGRVLLLNPGAAVPAVTSGYRPSGWDPGRREAHLGTIFDAEHPALRGMPSEGWCDLQFYDIVRGAQTILLDEIPGRLEPIVRVIDMPQRLSNKGLLAEARVGDGKLLLSGLNFRGAGDDPAGDFFLEQLVRYALSDGFRPAGAVPASYFTERMAAP